MSSNNEFIAEFIQLIIQEFGVDWRNNPIAMETVREVIKPLIQK